MANNPDMRIACVGDIHLISEQDPHQGMVKVRSFFIQGQNSLLKLFKRIEESDIDLVIFLGDLVDWASEENISFALEMLGQLSVPWKCVPGNHDFAIANVGLEEEAYACTADRSHRVLWQKHGISMENAFVDCGDFGLILLDNAMSNVETDDLQWLDQQLNHKAHNIVCQHVPLALPEINQCFQKIAPSRHLGKYTCSAQKNLYQDYYHGRVQSVVCGHVHFSATVQSAECTHYLCNLGISMFDPGRDERSHASATVLSFVDGDFKSEVITV